MRQTEESYLMNIDFVYTFIRQYKYGVLSTVSSDNSPQSACIGIAATPELKIIFDTVSDSRKYTNILLNPNVSLVIGCDNERTIQYEGIAKIPNDKELRLLLPMYYDVFPDGIDRKRNWKRLVYVCIEPKWIRYSDFNEKTQEITEMKF